MNSSRAAGQWDRIQRTKRALPYILYVRTTAGDPRPEHLVWAGTILPADDPFWTTHFPPNGWGCKCTVRQITRRERDRLLSSTSAIIYSIERPVIETRPFRNRRTGEITHVPVGIDPGWHSNPGLAASRRRAAAEALRDRAEAAAAVPTLRDSAQRIVSETVESDAFTEHHRRAVALANDRRRMREEAIAAGRSRDEAEALVNENLPWSHAPMPVAVIPRRLVPHLPDAGPLVVTVTDNAVGHSYEAHPTTAEEWRLLQRALDAGEIHVSDAGDRVWALLDVEGRTWVSVIRILAGRWRVITHFAPRGRGNYRANQRKQPGRRVVLDEKK